MTEHFKGKTAKGKGSSKVSARSLALETLIEILEKGAFANIAVNKSLSRYPLKGPERGLFTELVYGVSRTRNTLDWLLSKFLKRELKALTPQIRNILRLGIYQLHYLDKIPPHAAIFQSVELAKTYGHRGVAGLVNGVLRNYLRSKNQIGYPSLEKEPILHLSLKYSHPEWLISRWLFEFGLEETISLCQYNNAPAKLSLRVNTLKSSRQDLLASLSERGLQVTPSEIVPEGIVVENWQGIENIPEFRAGHFLMQDEASMLVSHFLNPSPKSTVVDVCAAPGTKTTHLAQLMEDGGKIFAFDIHSHKLKLIEENCIRLGIQSVEINLGDGRQLQKQMNKKVDYVLVDAPCSGLGVLGRRADSRWRKKPDQLKELPLLQKDILLGAAKILLPGGVLIYSTCSIAKEENQEVIEKFLAEEKDFVLESLIEHLPSSMAESLRALEIQKGMIQFLPQRDGIDGFFVARMRRR